MKFKELIEYLDECYPRSLSMAGDGDGVDVCADYDTEIGGVLLVLDVTLGAIEYAKAHAYNCILSHHAMIYSSLKKLDANLGAAARKAAMLARADICSAAFHTRLDSVDGGVNDCLLAAVGINKSELLICDGVPIGRICDFEREISVAEFARHVNASLNKFFADTFKVTRNSCTRFTDGESKIKRLGVIAGSGMSFDFINQAAEAGVDTFLTGEGKFHDILAARENYNLNIITAGHFDTEAVVLPEIKRAVLARFPDTRIDYFVSDCAVLMNLA